LRVSKSTQSAAALASGTLELGSAAPGQNRLECRTCPYEFALKSIWYERKYMKRKEVEDVLGGAGAWDNVDSTQALCPRMQDDGCDGDRAFYYQVQIRSADEPMTTFYKV
jgi:DNA-directed RNA polymerase III subunit RPC11